MMTPESPYIPPSLDEVTDIGNICNKKNMQNEGNEDNEGNHSKPADAVMPGLMEEGATLLSSVQTVIAKSLDLLAMETKRASLSLIWMFALAFVLAVLLISAWLGLMAVLALSAVAWGWSWIAAILVLVAINLCSAFGVIYWCQQLSKDLLFVASRRQFAHRLVAQSTRL